MSNLPINQDIKFALDSLVTGEGISKGSNNPYFFLDLKFKNGYSKRVFLNSESLFCIVNAVEQGSTPVDVNFED